MQRVLYLFLILGIGLSMLGTFFLANPDPKYVPKLTYRLIMRYISEEGSIGLTKLYGAISLTLGIVFLIFFLIAYLEGWQIQWH